MSEGRTNLDRSVKHYDAERVEQAIYRLWDSHNAFVADNSSKKPSFSIVIPPPNVTGRLHMGHALNNTLQDALIRYKRMDGFNVLWVPGTDHAGISTQSVVKKHLDAEGIDYKKLGREKMVERIWEWKEKYGDQILLQLRRLGCSCDWSRTRFTMDEGLSAAVRTAFKRLYDAGLIYRGKYIVNWCPADKTALSDDEVETKDGGEPGHFWYFKYPFSDGSGYLSIATTRPETMLGDTAVAVNPKDERFAALIGKTVTLPLVERELPIIADDFVDPEFGTGCVKVTPAHDPNDFQIGLRYNLEQINIMHEDASLNDSVPEQFRGMDRYVARKAVVKAMDDLGLLEKVEEKTIPVGRSYRSKEIIEYRLSDQWFVKMKPLAAEALKASEAGRLSYYPERWDSFYRDWLEKTRDWCISRQLWWGHRIPAWHNRLTGEIVVDVDTPAVVRQNPDQWYQDEDVLDTWFSSALWPFSTLGWPEDTQDLKTYYPTSVLVTGKDIIFFWVARMVMTGLFNMKEVPFHGVLINSIICDEDGETMSKSKGNGIDPLHVISGASLKDLEGPVYEARPANLEKILARIERRFPRGFKGVGADALRYTMLTGATDAQQIQLSLKRFDEVGRPFTDKIWNASKLALTTLESCPAGDVEPAGSTLEDSWIIGRLDQLVREVRAGLDGYSFHRVTDVLYKFFWDDLCDWYLEISKYRLREGQEGDARRVALVLSECFSVFVRLAHPIMPFITEEIWGHLRPVLEERGLLPDEIEVAHTELCAHARFPEDRGRYSDESDSRFEQLREVVRSVRNMRAHASVSPKIDLEAVIIANDANTSDVISGNVDLLIRIAGFKSLALLDPGSTAPEKFAVTVLDKVQVCVNLAEHMDVGAELIRNERSLAKINKEISQLESKLGNEKFVSKAPATVVETERQKLHDATQRRDQVLSVIGELEGLQ